MSIQMLTELSLFLLIVYILILQAWAVERWITGGAPPEKLIMGLTGAATTFTLYDLTSNFTGVGAQVERPGKPGPYIQAEGHVTYYRVSVCIIYVTYYR